MNTTQGYKNALTNLLFGVVTAFIAWVLGKSLWFIIENILSSLRSPASGDWYIDEISNVLFLSRVAFWGVILMTIISPLISICLIEPKTGNKITRDLLFYGLSLILTSYIVIAWNYQASYWRYMQPTFRFTNQIETALMITIYNIIKAISTFSLLTADIWKCSLKKLQMNPSVNSLVSRAILYMVIHLLFYWSAIPNENLGLPAILTIAAIALITRIVSFRISGKAHGLSQLGL